MLDFLAKVLSCGKLQGGDLELFITALLDVAKDIAVAVLEAVRAFLSSLGFTTSDLVEGSAEALSAASADPCLSGGRLGTSSELSPYVGVCRKVQRVDLAWR